MLQPHLTHSTESTTAVIRRAAFDVLAQREHSRQELIEKLLRKFKKRSDLSIPEAKVIEVVTAINNEGLQSDTRYIEMLVRSRISQGHGPVRIAQELKQKGLAFSDCESVLDSRSEEWFERARQARQKKFGAAKSCDQKEKARQMRFLQYRGFTSEQIRFALT